jgi:hypothetical protein
MSGVRLMYRMMLCRVCGHRWRTELTKKYAPACELFDWPDDREPETECECLRCGVKRSAWLAEKEKEAHEQSE